jgi:DUF1680 family protein
MELGDGVGDLAKALVERWLLVAPKANPAMLEMFRDRDVQPLRELVPWAGEFAGKYLTSAVEMLRVTGDVRLKAWIKEFVGVLIPRQAEDGYLGPWPKAHRLTNTAPNSTLGDGTWDTWGHYHIMMGLLLWHEESRDHDALDCTVRMADLLCKKYGGEKKVRLVDTGNTEMNLAPIHSLCLVYRKTGETRYLDLAQQIANEFAAEKDGEPLAGDYLRQALAGREFFQTPRPRWESLHPIMGLAELYWITGEASYKTAFEQIWWSIAQLDRHNNGGFSSGEKATGNPYHQAAIESCCTIAWMALSVEMLKLTGNSIVADELELSLLNSVMGMHSPTGRWATYDTPMNGVRKASAHAIVFQAREGSPELNCCSVNTPRGVGLLSAWALMKDGEGLRLSYYGASTLTARLKRGLTVELKQKTRYPLEGAVTIQVNPSKRALFALRLRIPHWSKKTRVLLNGKRLSGVVSGTYLTIEREWQKGDRIELALDLSLRVWKGERDCRGQASLYRGPILLTYDKRYNLQHGGRASRQGAREEKMSASERMVVPPLSLKTLKVKQATWTDWLPPKLLLEVKTAGGKTVHLCDFASAGEAGTPYCSWLPVTHCPPAQPFTPTNPLRSCSL